MAVLFPILLALQTLSSGAGAKPQSPADSTRPRLTAPQRDSVRRERAAADSARRAARLAARRIPVTPEVLRTAFADDRARALFERAKRARLEQDSTLGAYDVTAYQRLSAGIAFKRLGRERLAFRTENVSRVRWSRTRGAFVDLLGARTVMPAFAAVDADDPDIADAASGAIAASMSPIPYFPGRDDLMPMLDDGVARARIEEDKLIHPLADGAEAYYHYSLGDSLAFRLPDGRTITLREMKVRARRPQWNLAIASLWFDAANARLVRAAYRLSEPMDIWKVARENGDKEDQKDMDDVPVWVRPMLTPMTANVSAITIEYGLHQGRWWLPRVQMIEGDAEVSFMRFPFSMKESFKYAAVSGDDAPSADSLPTVAGLVAADSARRAARRAVLDSLMDDTTAAGRAVRDSVRKALDAERREARKRRCDADGTYIATQRRYGETLPVAVRIPCDTAALARAPQLPPSIYDPGDELFGEKELRTLREAALTLGAQAAFDPQRPTLGWGARYLRFNRVEGLSVGAAVDERLGAGYTAQLLGRVGVADWQPNGELALSRSDGERELRLGVYRRLNAANDWGAPLSVGASLSGLLFGRDEGFYYRSWGAELAGGSARTPIFRSDLSWRLFAERQWDAPVETSFSLPHLFNGNPALPNIDAPHATAVGLATELHATHGEDPRGLRFSTVVRAEGAFGTYDYTRALLDLTTTRALGPLLDGALTLSAGTSGGTVPAQRLFYLGGSQTVRGQLPGTNAGDAFWLARAELGGNTKYVRPTLFGDLGWAGARHDWSHPGRPLSGVGAGASVMDGLVRLDVSRGLHPREKWRADLYTEARF
ncbi:MAG: hypothetical protein ACJ79S_03670 [Gemmatimonadaceae bacterium]